MWAVVVEARRGQSGRELSGVCEQASQDLGAPGDA